MAELRQPGERLLIMVEHQRLAPGHEQDVRGRLAAAYPGDEALEGALVGLELGSARGTFVERTVGAAEVAAGERPSVEQAESRADALQCRVEVGRGELSHDRLSAGGRSP
jgi:hypothetical protein